MVGMRKRWDSACYRELGAELRKRRKEAGLTEAELGRQLGWSASKVARCEFGQVKLNTIDVITYLAFCDVYGKRSVELRAMCREAELTTSHWIRRHELGLPETIRSLIFHEATADVSTCYEPNLIPGLLQTEDYIRARTTERWPNWDPALAVRIRKQRQRIVHRPSPGQFVFFIHENALRLIVGGAAIMHDQMLALLLLDGLQHVAIHIVPAAAGAQAILGGPFRLLEWADHGPLVYLDGPTCGLFLEDSEYVEDYRALIPVLADIALNEGQSREFLAAMASDYDRERADVDDHQDVEEK